MAAKCSTVSDIVANMKKDSKKHSQLSKEVEDFHRFSTGLSDEVPEFIQDQF